MRHLAGDPDGVLGWNHQHGIFHFAGDRAAEGQNQLPLTVMMSGNILFLRHHADAKCDGRIVLAIGIIAVQSQTISLSDISDKLSF